MGWTERKSGANLRSATGRQAVLPNGSLGRHLPADSSQITHVGRSPVERFTSRYGEPLTRLRCCICGKHAAELRDKAPFLRARPASVASDACGPSERSGDGNQIERSDGKKLKNAEAGIWTSNPGFIDASAKWDGVFVRRGLRPAPTRPAIFGAVVGSALLARAYCIGSAFTSVLLGKNGRLPLSQTGCLAQFDVGGIVRASELDCMRPIWRRSPNLMNKREGFGTDFV